MDVWDVIILPILVMVGSFILASFLTPLGVYVIDTYGEKIIRRLFRWSIVMDKTKQCTSYKIGGVYIPQPIKNAINKLNLCKYFSSRLTLTHCQKTALILLSAHS